MNPCRVSLSVAFASAALVFGVASPAGAADDRPALSVSSADSTYATGAPAALTFTVSNGTSTPCQLSRSSYGTYTIEAMTRDGHPVAANLASTTFYDGIDTEIRNGMTTVAPGKSITIRPTVIDDSLASETPIDSGEALTSLWPMSAVGRYTVTVLYTAPRLDSLPDQCVGDSAPTTVSFSIAMSTPSHSLRWIEIVAGGVVIIVLLIALWWWLRRRGNHSAAAAAAILMIVGVVTAGTSVGAHPASANWITAGGGADFLTDVKECFARFEHSYGGDPSHIMPELEDPSNNLLTIEPPVDPAQGSSTTHTPKATGGMGSSTLIWNDADIKHPDGGAADRCADLYHELVHAYQDLYNSDSLDYCDGTHIFYDEVDASIEENEYRATHHDGQRKYYDSKNFPDSLSKCGPRKPVEEEVKYCFVHPGNQMDVGVYVDEQARVQADAAPSNCAMSNGDPHILTFDGRRYDFQAVGEFVDTRSASGDLEIQTRQSPLPGSRYASIDTAIAMRVGADKVGFYYDQGAITVHVNGFPIATIGDATTDTGTMTLPGGGTIERHPSSVPSNGDAFTVTWPDGSAAWIDPVRPWGLRLEVQLAGARARQVTGLLGDFDGNTKNDLTTGTGTVLPDVPTYAQLYHDFADSWRVSQSASLFDYASGQTTATFTDRTFPDQLKAGYTGPSAQAKAECTYAGVTDPGLLADCAFDLDATGSLAFAADDAEIQQEMTAPSSAATPSPAQTGTVTVTGADATGSFAFTGAAGQQVYISIATTGLPEGCYVSLTGPAGAASIKDGCVEAGLGTLDTTVLSAAGQYHVVLAPPAGSSGTAQVQVYTDVDETVPITIGGAATVAISQPGAVATATFTAVAGQKIYADVSTDFDGTCGELQLLGPADNVMESGCVIGRSGSLDGMVLPTAGTYKIIVDPAAATTGSATIHLTSATDQTQSTTIGGAAVTLSVHQAGATSTVTFPATAGEQFAAVFSTPDFNACGLIALYAPDGSELTSACLLLGVGAIGPITLAATGTYRLVLDPSAAATGSVTAILAHQ